MKFLKTCLAALTLFAATAYAETSSVWLTDSSGSVTELKLADVPNVRYFGSEIVVTAGETELRFEGEGISFTFTDPEKGAVEQTSIPGKNIAVAVAGDSVTVSGLMPGAAVAAYTAAGVKTAETAVSVDGCATLSLSPGINIIVTESKTFKVIIK